jgi:hypothetical protein
MKIITAKFAGVCFATGTPIKAGDKCKFDPRTHRVFCLWHDKVKDKAKAVVFRE